MFQAGKHLSSPFILERGRTLAVNCVEYTFSGKVSFSNVVTFNMDEYVGLSRDHPESYWSFMQKNFFKHIDMRPENINILNGTTNCHDEECRLYEEKVMYRKFTS